MGFRGRLSARRRAVLGEGSAASLLVKGQCFLKCKESLKLSVRMAVSFRISMGLTMRWVSATRLPETEATADSVGSVCMAVSALAKEWPRTGNSSVEMPTSTMKLGAELGAGAMYKPFMLLKGVSEE